MDNPVKTGFVNDGFKPEETTKNCSETINNNLNNSRLDVSAKLDLMVNLVSAVVVRNAKKSYRSSKGTSVVLNDFNMTVQEGSIYSLLGSSGCGKTTLLSCCVGVKNLDEGQIRIFGSKPGTRKCGVPGRNVGYMPQEIALYPELTIREVLLYYGRMFGMTTKAVDESMEFLINFLALPPSDRRINSLSGGQMRRVSFSVALVHSPRLLILDEPTVGVDPLLRKSIWNHLVKLVSNGRTTVIITTHYIEEARQSNQIGLMRGGRLLAEDAPDNLLRMYKTNLLEDIVLKLCLQDNADVETLNSSSSSSTCSGDNTPRMINTVIISDDAISPQTDEKQLVINQKSPFKNKNVFYPSNLQSGNYLPTISYGDHSSVELRGVKGCNRDLITDLQLENNGNQFDKFNNHIDTLRRESSQLDFTDSNRFRESAERINAMALKNTVSLLRNIPFLLFIFFMPALQVIIVCIAIGQDPKGLKFGLVNFDANNSRNCVVSPGCIAWDNYTGSVSCRFLDILDKHGTLHITVYDTEEEAAYAVAQSSIWGYLMFTANYTVSMKDRAIFGVHAEPEAIHGSRVKFRLDQSNLQIFRETSKVFLESFSAYMRSISEDCNIDPLNAEPPIYFAQPIFGEDSINFTDFLAPSVLLAILFFFPLTGSGIAYITEKKMGTLSRSLVAGVTSFEIMIAYLIVQLGLLVVQVALSFAILNLVFKIQIAGPIHCAFLLAIFVGLAGMSMGFLMAAFCNEEIEAVLIALGTFLPNMLLSGLLWPLEGMPIYLQYFSKILPCTWAGEAMRSVLTRGVGYLHPTVWPGFLSVGSWILIYWTLNILLHKFKSGK